jgi:hypothetical protein
MRRIIKRKKNTERRGTEEEERGTDEMGEDII